MLNLYTYYENPSKLDYYDKKDLIMPDALFRFYHDHMADLSDAENRERYPEYVKQIARIPELAYDYAKEKLTGRWPEAEKYIKDDPHYALKYTLHVINRDKHQYRDKLERWPEAETAILAGPADYIWEYVQWVIKGRWDKAEEVLPKKSPAIWGWYQSNYILDNWN